jgi:protein-S-isoprenylcysteine O-methyltransferase Ste14
MLRLLERGLELAAGLAGLGTLVLALSGLLRGVFEPRESETGTMAQAPRWPLWLLGAAVYCALGVWLWKPISVVLPLSLHWMLYIVGVPLYLAGLMLYLRAMQALGRGYHPSGKVGVDVAEDDELITSGPYAYLRHPMYFAVFMAVLGGLMIFRTWAMVFFAVSSVTLVYLAQREDQALEQAFGERWQDYRRKVSAWIPRPARAKEGGGS